MYRLKFTTSAERYFKKIKENPLKEAFQTSILALVEDPYLSEAKQGDLTGIYGYDVVKYKKSSHEIAYRIYEEDNK